MSLSAGERAPGTPVLSKGRSAGDTMKKKTNGFGGMLTWFCIHAMYTAEVRG